VTLPLRLRGRAELDLNEAYVWYEARSKALGIEADEERVIVYAPAAAVAERLVPAGKAVLVAHEVRLAEQGREVLDPGGTDPEVPADQVTDHRAARSAHPLLLATPVGETLAGSGFAPALRREGRAPERGHE